MEEPGLDRHEWQTEWEALEPLVAEAPDEALPDLDQLLERMLVGEDYPLGSEPVDDGGIDPEVLASFQAAREIARRIESGAPVDPGEVGHAIELYRELYDHLMARRQHSG